MNRPLRWAHHRVHRLSTDCRDTIQKLHSGIHSHYKKRVTHTRAQTSIDLVFAVTLFFLGFSLMIATQPALFFPGELSATDERVTADTVANELIHQELSANGGTGISHEQTEDFVTTGSLNDATSLQIGQDILVTLSVADTSDAPPVFNSEGTTTNGRIQIEVGTEPQPPRTTVVRQTTLLTEPVTLTIEVGSET